MAKIRLEVVTPIREVFAGEVDEVRAPGADGLFGVLPGHAAFLTAMDPGELMFRTGNQSHRYAVGHGFIEVADDRVSVLADTAEAAEEIDLERAKRAGEDARRRLASLTEASPEFPVERARLQRATARIGVAGTRR